MNHEELMKTAMQCYKDHNGFNDQSVSSLLREFYKDSTLLSQALYWAASEAMRECQRKARVLITNQPVTPKKYTVEQQTRVVEQCFTFLYWPLMGGILLKDATREQILMEADKYRSFKEGNALKERYMRLVASRLKEGEKAGSLKEEELRNLYHEAKLNPVAEESRYVG